MCFNVANSDPAMEVCTKLGSGQWLYTRRVSQNSNAQTYHAHSFLASMAFIKRRIEGACHRSMPLIIPDDTSYDSSTNELKTISSKVRSGLKLVPETLDLLRTIERPLAVLAIGGPCRTGKSYILSRILGSTDAFALGHTFDSKTLGIWIGTTVLDSDKFTILLMDTEGIDSVFAKSGDDARILVMTILLSSYFIYNSLGVPHHGDLEKMRLASC